MKQVFKNSGKGQPDPLWLPSLLSGPKISTTVILLSEPHRVTSTNRERSLKTNLYLP